MKRYLPVFAALAMSLTSGMFVPSLKASQWDKKTIITISRPVAVEETILPAGQYVLKLVDSSSRRDVVAIFNGEGTQLITTVLAIPAYRLNPTDKGVFSVYDAPAGQPLALHTWFYSGDDNGLEFLKPQYPRAAGYRTARTAAKKTPARPPQPTAAVDSGGGN
jgi:hypothetical protein